MVLIAFSVQDQVERYGAYVSIACFFGLAVLSLLYFSQARELKRLREWAGRAPERAQELEQRVVAQAAASAARRVPAMPVPPGKGVIAPPRRLAEMPAPPPTGAATAAGAQATELAEAVEADPATNGNVPAAPAAGAPANGAAPPEDADAPADGESAEAEREPGEQPEAAGAAVPADSAVADGSGPGDERAAVPGADGAAAAVSGPDDERAAEAGPEGDRAAVVEGAHPEEQAEPPAERVPPEPAIPAAAAGAAAPAPGGPGGAPTAGGAPAQPGDVPPATAVPRATPAQRVGVTPRPAPMPLRQSSPSAVSAGRGGRRPAAPSGRRTAAKPPREGRSAGTVALLVGLTVLLLGGGAFAVSQLTGGDDAPAPPNQAAPPPTATEEPASGGGAEPPPPAETNVAVLNGTTYTGLAGQLADRVAQEGGYQRGITETNTRDQTIQQSVVYYADGSRASARAVGELLSIDNFEPIDAETQALAPGADIVVLAGADQAP